MVYYNTTKKRDLLLGVGRLYALPYSEFNLGTFDEETNQITGWTDVADMDEVGYIAEEATFTREWETVDINSANYGKVTTIKHSPTTTFDTGVISFDQEMVNKYLTGSTQFISADGERVQTIMGNSEQPPFVSLVYVGTDKASGKALTIVMPRCQWTANYELGFKLDEPVSLNWTFDCTSCELPTGEWGAAYTDLPRVSTTTSDDAA